MKNVDLINGPIDSSLRKFALPLAASFLIHMVYHWVDMYYVSRLGDEAMAAVGVAEQLLFFAFGIGMGFGVGTGIIVARRVGEKAYKEAGRTASQALVFMFSFALLIAATLHFMIPVALDILNIKGLVREYAQIYLSIISLGMPFNFLIFQVNAMIRSSGNSIIPMIILITANLFNAVISPFFIFGIGPFPEWGIFGAGFATALAQFLGAIIANFILFVKFHKIEISFKKFKVDFGIIYNILRLGVPASLQVNAVSVNRMVLTWMTNLFGANVLTTYMLGLRVDLLVFMSIFAVGAAVEITTGQNLGAKKIERVFQYHKSAVKQLSVLIFSLGIVVFFGGEYFARIFTDNQDIIDKMSVYLKIISFSYVFFAIGIISIRVISGAGDYFRSFKLVAAVLFIIQTPLAYILSNATPLDHRGIWYGILASQIAFAIIAIQALKKRKWINAKV